MLSGCVLTFDFAQSTGYAFGEPGSVPQFSSHKFPSSGENYGRHNANIRSWVRQVVFDLNPTLIGYESPSIFNKTTPSTVRKLAAYGGVLEEECLREGFNVEVVEINPAQIKPFFAGKGAKKADVERAARRYGFRVQNDDEADALAMWFWLIHLRGSEAQKQQFQAMQYEASMGRKQGAKF